MNCFNNYVGIKGCSTGVPGSGLFINSLPGFPTEFFSKIASSDQATFLQVWEDIQITAHQRLLSDVTVKYNSRYKLRSLARFIDIGKQKSTNPALSNTGKFRGFGVNADSGLASQYTRSNLMAIAVDYLELHCITPFAGEVAVKIWDGDTGTVLFSTTVNTADALLVAGFNAIPVNMVFSSKHLLFGYDATLLDGVTITISSSATASLCDCLCEVTCCNLTDCPGKVYGFESAALTDVLDLTEGDDSMGLTGKISFLCSYENFICNNKQLFSRAWWYLLGAQAIWWALNSPSFSRANTVDKKPKTELGEDFQTLYEEQLDIVLRGTNLDESDICIECDPPIARPWINPYNN